MEQELNETDDPDDCGFADLVGGSTIRFRVSEESLGVGKFLETSKLDFRRPREDYDEDILEKVVNLDEVLRIKTYDEVAKLFTGSDDDDEEEESKKPAKKTSPKAEKASKKKPEPEPEPDEDEDDDDWDDDDDADDEDEDEKPASKKQAKASKKKPEPEPDDDGDGDDDDDDWDDDDDADDDGDDDDADEDDDDDDWDDDDDADEDDDDAELTPKAVRGMTKNELLELFEDGGELEGKTKKTMTALKRASLDELRELVIRLIK